ncbi:MAG: Hpr family [Candidatus Tokpelaia sp. JSC161]|jgi:phosphocarrier protein|nr:MAG: Hpr family [Candidatus Tokpelaia sp. JSC161]
MKREPCHILCSDKILTRKVLICNKRGLHARASAKFVKVVSSYDNVRVTVEKDDIAVGGTSIMGLMILAASSGSMITIKASGHEAATVLDALEKLIHNRFGEYD